jgi:threonine/homoserine/homoserine lactone efflux protein
MMTYEILSALIVFSFVTSITPGPNNLMLLTSGVNFGFRKTIPHMLGIGIGFTLMMVSVGLGLSQVFINFPVANSILKIVGAAYMIYLAWKIAASSPRPDSARKSEKPMTFLQAVLFQWVNPKGWMMAITAISAYSSLQHPVLSIFVISLIFGAIMIPSISSWAYMGQKLKRFLRDKRSLRLFNTCAAVLLILSLYPVFL